MHRIGVLLSTACALALTGCEAMGTTMQSKTSQGAVLGGLLGAGTGAIVGNQNHHHAGAGTAIGAGLGTLGGGLIGHAMDEQGTATQRQTFPVATATPSTGVSSYAGQTKFCPVGGETYNESVKFCPIHGVELKYREGAAPTSQTN